MKKLFFLVTTLLMAYSSFGQSIGYRTESNGILNVGTNYLIRNHEVGIALNYAKFLNTSEERWKLSMIYIWAGTEYNFDKDSKLLIKTFSDKVIELSQKIDCQSVKRERECPISGDYSYFYIWRYPDYDITSDDLHTIMNDGIKKMRFETTRGMRDVLFEKDIWGNLIKSEYDLILGKSDFSSGF